VSDGADAAKASGSSDGSTLCLACGLCCDGTLFKSTRVDPWERPGLQRLGFRVIVQVGGEVGFVQPCVALEARAGESGVEHVCRHYAGRPETCRRFRCRLLVALEAGEVDLAEALAEVASVRAEVERVGALLPPDGDEAIRSVAQRARARAASGEVMGEALAAAQRELEATLDRRFRRRGRVG